MTHHTGSDEGRAAELAAAMCKCLNDGEGCINYDPDVAGGCSWCERDAARMVAFLAERPTDGAGT